jgi:hypothetical protein
VVDDWQQMHTRDEVVLVQYDSGDGLWEIRTGYYGITLMPTVCGDGMSDVWPLSWLEQDYQAHGAFPAPLRITLHEDAVGQFTAHIVAEEDVPVGAVFTMVAVEDDYVPASGGATSHLPYHARVFLTSPTGDAFEIAAGESVDITKTFTVDPSWDYGKMGVACWVQRPGGVNPSPQPYGDVPILNEVLQSAFVATGGSGIEEVEATRLALLPPSPNPFAETASLSFDTPAPGRVALEIFDVAGRRVATVLRAELPAGQHTARWDGSDGEGRPCAAGVYLARLAHSGGESATAKLVKLR